MSTLHPIEPGDLIDVNARLREVMSVLDNGAFALNVSFADLDQALEAEAVKMRHTLELSASRVMTVLQMIEAHPVYQRAKQQPQPTP